MKRSWLLFFIFFFSFQYSFAQQNNASDSGRVVNPSDSGYLVSFDSTKIYYEVYGNGFPVLLVHGFIANSQSWKRTALFDSLLASGRKVILVDMRGNGKSDKPHNDEAYINDAETKDLMLLITKLGINQYDVVGYSRGSIITSRLMVWDKRIRRGVLGGMGIEFTNPEWPRRIQFYHALISDTVPELHEMVQYIQQAGLDQQALALLQKYQPSTSILVLKTIKIPVLVIHGDLDNDNGSADQLALVFPYSEKAVVPGMHNQALQTPEFAQAVLSFLSK